VSFELSHFLFDLIDVCTTTNHVDCLTYCVLNSGGPVTFTSRSRVGVVIPRILTS